VIAAAIIPARLASSRFPEKIIASSTGRPLVQHVVDRVKLCHRIDQIVVAADHPRIVDALKPFGTRVILTDPNHPSGTDRIAEACHQIDAGVIVNVQGDEPEIEPTLIDQLVDRMARTNEPMATAAVRFPPGEDVRDPNRVKVVVDDAGCALYFSRSPIPCDRDNQVKRGEIPPPWLLHLGLYAYRREFLIDFASWKPTTLERLERLEQLRAVEHGVRIGVVIADHAAGGIDTPEQYAAFVHRFTQG
jgi:3-deoxy-manno-octulosonate cytidylyltransferase (CMP-KDO synthetase)